MSEKRFDDDNTRLKEQIKELEKENKKLKLQVELLKQIKPLHKLPKSINLVLKKGDD